MTTDQFNQSVTLEIRRLMQQSRPANKAKFPSLLMSAEDQRRADLNWPTIESQEQYWRDRDADLDRTESACQWYDEQGKRPF